MNRRRLGVGLISIIMAFLATTYPAHAASIISYDHASLWSSDLAQPYWLGYQNFIQPIGQIPQATSSTRIRSVTLDLDATFSNANGPNVILNAYTDASYTTPAPDTGGNFTPNGLWPYGGTNFVGRYDFTPTNYSTVTVNNTYYYQLEFGHAYSHNSSRFLVHGDVSPATFGQLYKTSNLGDDPNIVNAFFSLNDTDTYTEPATTTPACTPGVDPNCNSNVMFLPGIESSRLFADGNRIWEPNSFFGNHDIENLDMANPDARDIVHANEKSIMDTAYLGYNLYKSFVERMDNLKDAEVIADWEPIAYDWRLGYEDLLNYGHQTSNGGIYYRGLNAATTTDPYIIQQLKHLASTSRTKKVTIIAHSNGGLLAKQLMLRPELAQYVDKVILVAVPQLGTPQAIGGLLHGYNQSLPFEAFPIFITDADARYLGKNMPMAFNLLPSDKYFEVVQDAVVTFSSTTTADWKMKYAGPELLLNGITTQIQLKNFMVDSTESLRNEAAYDDTVIPSVVDPVFYDKAVTTHNQLDQWQPNGVQLVTIAGWGDETLSTIHYERVPTFECTVYDLSGNCISSQIVNRITYKPRMVIDGDGTVVEPSALWSNGAVATRYWVNLFNYNTDFTPRFKAQHANILEVPFALDLISDLVSSSTISTSPYVSATRPSHTSADARLHFILHSPLTLGFTDSEGNYTGSTATTTSFNIPGVDYERFGEVQWLSVPKSLAGKVIMRGTGSGSFALDIESVDGNTTLDTTTFAAVPSATSTIATVDIDPSVSPTSNGILKVDFNGDGVVDRTLQAKSGDIILPDLTAPEVIITVSTSTRDISVQGVDDGSPTTVTKTATTTVVTDQSGNKTILFFQKTFNGNVLTYAKLTGINYGTSTIPLPSSFLYVWDSSKTLVSQTVVVNSQFGTEALYDKKQDRTTIIVFRKKLPIQKTTLNGLRLIKLTTSKGAINYSW